MSPQRDPWQSSRELSGGAKHRDGGLTEGVSPGLTINEISICMNKAKVRGRSIRLGSGVEGVETAMRQRETLPRRVEASKGRAQGFALTGSSRLLVKGVGRPNATMKVTVESNAGQR